MASHWHCIGAVMRFLSVRNLRLSIPQFSITPRFLHANLPHPDRQDGNHQFNWASLSKALPASLGLAAAVSAISVAECMPLPNVAVVAVPGRAVVQGPDSEIGGPGTAVILQFERQSSDFSRYFINVNKINNLQ